nr:pyocin knob domain-containing protein [Shouchella lehensis]
MSFKEELPIWLNPGQKPPQPKIEVGYQPMDHPPADWFNWYQHTVYKAIKEIQEIAATAQSVTDLNKKVDDHASLRNNPHGVTKAQVGLGSVDNVKQATKNEFDGHTSNKENPHWVTKGQVGLGNVDNVKQATKNEFDDHKNNTNNPHSTTKAQVGLGNVDDVQQATKKDFDAHVSNKSNPHSVTRTQVGLGNVDNVKQATKNEFDDHQNDKNNPHDTTKSQVGLGNVDNIRQAAKADFDAFVSRRNNPHQVTTEQVNVITVNAASVSGTNYPIGISVFATSANGIDLGYPINQAIVHTEKLNNSRCIQFVYDGNAGTDGIYTRTWRTDGGWRSFIQLETTDGSAAKVKASFDTLKSYVDAHINDRSNPHGTTKAQVGLSNVDNVKQATKTEFDSHVNNGTPHASAAEKARWNAAEQNAIDYAKSFGLGTNAKQLPAQTDLNNLRETGFYRGVHFTNAPFTSANQWHAVIHFNYDVTAEHASQILIPIGAAARQAVYTRHKSGSNGWSDWTELETTDGAQSKVNAHANLKNNPHNVTSEQTSAIGLRSANDTGADYPNGMSFFNTGDGLNMGWPYNIVLVVTYKHGNHRLWQYAYNCSGQSTGVQFRSWRQDNSGATFENGWRPFAEIETTTGAQSKVDNHANLKNNPHSVTKSQVGLGNVPNWGGSSQAQARAGTDNSSTMTPLRVNEAIKALATSNDINTTTARTTLNDPISSFPVGLSITKINGAGPTGSNQYGLLYTMRSNSDNSELGFQIYYRTDSTRYYSHHFRYTNTSTTGWFDWYGYETTEGSQEKVNATQVHKVTENVGFGIHLGQSTDLNTIFQTGFYRHQGTSSNNAPVTGWGYLIVNQQAHREAMQMFIPFTNGDIWVRTSNITGEWRGWNKQATDGELKAHSNATNNPHNVTKSQVGLSNVSNFGVANQATAEAGTNNSVYMTPLRTKQAIDSLQSSANTNMLATNALSPTASPNDYPDGITTFQVTSSAWVSATGNGQVVTYKNGSLRVYQEFFAHANPANSISAINKYYRWGYSGSWSTAWIPESIRMDKMPADRVASLHPSLTQLSNYTVPGEFYLTTEEYNKMSDTPTLTSTNDMGWWGHNSYADAGEGIVQTLKSNSININIEYKRVLRRNSNGPWILTSTADTGWVNLPNLNGVRNYQNNIINRPQVRKIGNIVYLRAVWEGITSQATVATNLPVEFRPDVDTQVVMSTTITGGVAQFARWSIHQGNGNVYYNRSSNGNDGLNATYWFPMNVSWAVGTF